MNARTLRVCKWILVNLLCLSASSSMLAQTGRLDHRADRILVKPKPGADLSALHARFGAQVHRAYPAFQNLQVLRLPPLADPRVHIALYRQSGLVDYAEPDFVVRALGAPNDAFYASGALWGLHNTGQSGGRADADIDAPEGWDAASTAPGIVVAIIDTGARYTHEDLAANMWVNPGESGRDFLGRNQRGNFLDDDGNGRVDDVHGVNAILDTGAPWDDNGHGTHVSGTVGAVGNNGVGVAGVSWEVQLMALKFLDALGQGFVSDAIECIDYARRKEAKIINASWGGYNYSAALRDAIAGTRDAGMIFVAAAGNDATDNDAGSIYPAGYDLENIIAVAATTRLDELAAFSNFGATTVDLGAPGAEILSTWNATDKAYQYLNGTSMATPHVAGACALVWARHFHETYWQIKNRVLGGTDPLPSLAAKCVTGGRLNLRKALGSEAPTPTRPVVTVAATDPNASEAGDAGRFTLTRTGGTASPLTVRYSLEGTAGNGTDYSTLPTSAVIPVGSLYVEILVSPLDDSVAEGDEAVVLGLSAGAAYAVGSPGRATVTVTDNDSALLPPIIGGLLSGAQGSDNTGIHLLSLASGETDPARTISLSILGGPATPIGEPGSTGSGGDSPFHIRLFGNPDALYVLQASSDLIHWTAIGTNQAGLDGVVTFIDARAGEFTQRFYRGARAGAVTLDFRPGRILVKPKAGVDLTVLYDALGLTVLKVFPAIGNLQIVSVPEGALLEVILTTLIESGLVHYAERDFVVRALVEPNDTHYLDGSLWNLHNTGQFDGTADADIDAPEAWDSVFDASSVLIAVIDTGVRYTHEDLAANIWVNPGEIPGNGVDDNGSGYIDDVHGINALNGSGDPNDDHGHGTHIAGIIGAVGNNGVGVTGVAWRVQLMALKFINAHGDGLISDAIACIDYARTHGAQAINASWGGPEFTSQALSDAIASARDAGILFVAAAGNSGIDNDTQAMYPANYDLDNVLSVAATTRTDELANFSNYGATKVHLAAPGSPIGSCWYTSDSAYLAADGTSMAAAHVTGVAALLLAAYPDENYRQLIARLLSNVDPLPALEGRCVTGGRLNAQRALGIGSPPPELPLITVTASPADATEAGDTGTFIISRAGDTASALTVNYTMSGTAQNGADYQTLPSSVTIVAGADSANLIVTPIDDTGVEGEESVILALSTGDAYRVGSPGSATVTIADNDEEPPSELPVVWLSIAEADGSESGPTNGIVRFHRTGDPSQPIQVNWTFGGTAINGSDFEELPDGSPFPAGLSEADMVIVPIDDAEIEGDETVMVTLAPGSDYIIGSPDSGTVVIADNDEPPPALPTVTVTAADAAAGEPSNAGEFEVSRTGSADAALTVNYTLNGTAINGTDYATLSGSVTIPAGSTAAAIAVAPIDDSAVEGDETVVLTLSANAAYTVGAPGSATVALADNDEPPPALVADFTASPLLGLVPLLVEFTDISTGSPVAWSWSFGDGTTSGARHPTHIYLLPGSYTATLTVRNAGGATSSKSAVIRVRLL